MNFLSIYFHQSTGPPKTVTNYEFGIDKLKWAESKIVTIILFISYDFTCKKWEKLKHFFSPPILVVKAKWVEIKKILGTNIFPIFEMLSLRLWLHWSNKAFMILYFKLLMFYVNNL